MCLMQSELGGGDGGAGPVRAKTCEKAVSSTRDPWNSAPQRRLPVGFHAPFAAPHDNDND